MGYYSRGDYYAGDATTGPGMLQRMLQQHGITRAESSRLPFPIVAAEDIKSAKESGRQFTRHELATGIEESGGRHRGPRMNPLNPRALRRAMRRVQRFAKFASQTMSFTKRHKMKKRRRR